jgi:hypothetical protein
MGRKLFKSLNIIPFSSYYILQVICRASMVDHSKIEHFKMSFINICTAIPGRSVPFRKYKISRPFYSQHETRLISGFKTNSSVDCLARVYMHAEQLLTSDGYALKHEDRDIELPRELSTEISVTNILK